jgi:outer membrane protein W
MLRRLKLGFLLVLVGISSNVLTAQQEKGDREIAFQGTVTIPLQDASEGTLGTLIPRFGYFLNKRNFVGLENDDLFAKGYQAAGINLLYRFYFGAPGSRFQPYVGFAPGFLIQRQPVGVDIVVTSSSIAAAHNQINSTGSLSSGLKAADNAFLDAEVAAYEGGLFCPSITSLLNGQCTQVPSGTRHVASHDFQGSGELGFKFYLNRKFAFETSYRLLYVHQSTVLAQDLYTVTNTTLTPVNYTITFSTPTRHDGQQSGHLGFKESANNFILFGFSYVF